MPQSQQEYLDNLGGRCPNCGSENIDAAEAMDFESSPYCTKQVSCKNCDATWTDNYILISYSDLVTP